MTTEMVKGENQNEKIWDNASQTWIEKSDPSNDRILNSNSSAAGDTGNNDANAKERLEALKKQKLDTLLGRPDYKLRMETWILHHSDRKGNLTEKPPIVWDEKLNDYVWITRAQRQQMLKKAKRRGQV